MGGGMWEDRIGGGWDGQGEEEFCTFVSWVGRLQIAPFLL